MGRKKKSQKEKLRFFEKTGWEWERRLRTKQKLRTRKKAHNEEEAENEENEDELSRAKCGVLLQFAEQSNDGIDGHQTR